MKTWVKNLARQRFDRGRYSQSYQDALLGYLFDHLEIGHKDRFCVEFGFDGDTFLDGGGSNVAHLVLERGWECLLLDGNHSNADINLHQHFLTPENIVGIFQKYDVPTTPGYISIDVDSLDLWLFQSLLTTYRPMIFSVEYNAHLPLWASITVENDPNFRWQGDRLYGASLKALTLLANKHGYSLLWVVPKVDAFFIRNDLVEDGTDNSVFPFSWWRHATNIRVHPRVRNIERLKALIEYNPTDSSMRALPTNNNEALQIGLRYLAGVGDFETILHRLNSLPSRFKRRFFCT
jgi:hypothetical protein